MLNDDKSDGDVCVSDDEIFVDGLPMGCDDFAVITAAVGCLAEVLFLCYRNTIAVVL